MGLRSVAFKKWNRSEKKVNKKQNQLIQDAQFALTGAGLWRRFSLTAVSRKVFVCLYSSIEDFQ